MTQYVVPMFESERGWGCKIDGYAGPFDTLEDAEAFEVKFNLKHNNLPKAPDYYIMAMEPVPYRSQECSYRSTVDGCPHR